MPIQVFEIFGPAEPVLRAIALALVAVLWTVLLVRIVGLRSFSKMTNYDFVTTVATGSIIAQAATRADWLEYLSALGAIAGVFLVQYLLARLRQASDIAKDTMRNRPVLYVKDNGIGIPEQYRDAVFRIFRRLHARDEYGGGVGAGLTIVKKIIERHGGRIWIESEVGVGTTFYFTLAPTQFTHREHSNDPTGRGQ